MRLLSLCGDYELSLCGDYEEGFSELFCSLGVSVSNGTHI